MNQVNRQQIHNDLKHMQQRVNFYTTQKYLQIDKKKMNVPK